MYTRCHHSSFRRQCHSQISTVSFESLFTLSQEYCMLFKNLVSVDQGFFCWCQKNKNTRKIVFSSIAKSRKVFLFRHSFLADVKKSFKMYFCSCNFIQKNPYQSKLISALTQKQFLSVIILAFIFVEIFYFDVSINVSLTEKCF